MNFFYNILFLPILRFVKFLLSYFNEKVKLKSVSWEKLLKDAPKKSSKRILVHSSSMGEFEQSKYLLKLLKENGYEIIASFFSPSGYENQKKFEYIDYALYLPFDIKKQMKFFFDKIEPDFVIINRYDLWWNFLTEANKKLIPVYLINATFPKNKLISDYFFLRLLYNRLYSKITKIYSINNNHANLFNYIKINNVKVLADTRIDWLLYKVRKIQKEPKFKKLEGYTYLVAGSTWEADNRVLKYLHKNSRKKIILIIAPHEPNLKNISYLKENIRNTVLFSKLDNNNTIKNNVIVDTIGNLLDLYSIADIAYVGGAFGSGVHSILEPAAFGIPVVSGNKSYSSSPDATTMKNNNILFTVNDGSELLKIFLKITSKDNYKEKYKMIVKEYFEENSGSSEIIYNDVNSYFTNAND